MKVTLFFILTLSSLAIDLIAQPAWQTGLDSRIRFYETTDFGIVLAGTEKSLYAVDGQTGERIWRRQTGRINETAVTPVPGTDLILFTRDLGDKSRLEAVDVMTGERLWQSDKVKGDVMQLAADPQNDLLAVVLVKGAKGRVGDELKRKPVMHMLQFSTGDELWKRELEDSVEMMPARFGDRGDEVAFTLDNYRAPLILDGRLYLFYEGSTSYDAHTGKEKQREKFKVNESGLALTEADPVIDEQNIYVSGRGRIRAISRRTGDEMWKADDLGTAAEIALFNGILYVRTGGQFTRIKDGEIVSKGPYGISAIDATSGDTIWRYKGADKGLTNFAFKDANTIFIADDDVVINLNATTGKRRELKHKIEKPQFVLINENGETVVGGKNEIGAFRIPPCDLSIGVLKPCPPPLNLWHVKHKPPARGAFAIVGGIGLRATALYFRYGGVATSAFGLARGGMDLASAANTFRWSGMNSRFGSFDLTTLASNSARNYAMGRIYVYGSLTGVPGSVGTTSGLELIRPPSVVGRMAPTRGDVQESVFDRLDPTRQLDKLSDYLLRRRRVTELRGNYMYFFTDLAKPFNRKGLVGVNIHTGQDARFILDSDPDDQFVTDETANLLYSADGNNLQAFEILNR